MAETSKAPFRGDQVGSLLRSAALHEARAKAEKGEIDQAALRAAEDKAIRDVVALQESAGLKAITDGELRRAFWHVDFLTGFDGIVATQGNYPVTFRNAQGETANTRSQLLVEGKVRRSRPIMVDHFKFLKAATKGVAKMCIPAPTYLHMRGGRRVIGERLYPDWAEFWSDITRAYRAEIDDLVAAGCTYLQLDDVSVSCLGDPALCEQIKRDGEDPATLPKLYAGVLNGLIAGRPKSLSVTMHTCRGNFQSMWLASGGYDAVAETIFGTVDVDGFFLEYDTERAGGFEPLRFVPKGKRVVLGLVSTKVPELESKDMLKRRIDAAAKYVAMDDLCLSPQCGFASTHHGNKVTVDDQRRKLELVVQVATEVWGGL